MVANVQLSVRSVKRKLRLQKDGHAVLLFFKGGLLDFVTDRIAIGCHTDFHLDHLRRHGIGGVLNVAKSLNVSRAITNELEYNKVGLRDSEDNLHSSLHAAVLMVDQLLARHKKIMVNCHAGASRSVTVVALWLVLRQEMSWDDALTTIKSKRKEAGPQPGMIKLAQELLANLVAKPVI